MSVSSVYSYTHLETQRVTVGVSYPDSLSPVLFSAARYGPKTRNKFRSGSKWALRTCDYSERRKSRAGLSLKYGKLDEMVDASCDRRRRLARHHRPPMIPTAELITFVLGMIAASVAAAIGSYASDKLQGRRQRSEWVRQEERARQEKVELAERERLREEEAKAAAIRAVALEALWNALALITFAARVKTWKDARLSLFREQFDRSLPVLASDVQRLQMVASTYVRGMAFERSINGLRAFEGRIAISPENAKEALDLSMGFQIVFRDLGYRVLSKPAMEEFERTLNVAQAESN